MSHWTIAVLTLGCVAVVYIGRQAFRSRTSFPLPPGPPGLPWIGNVIGVDTSAPWKTYAKWARTYGNLVYSKLMGKDVIIINSEQIARELLENRSRNYSDRPRIITSEMSGIGFNSAFLPYSDRWRLHRRFFHQTFHLDVVSRFWPLQHHKACHFLRQLFDAPQQLDEHLFEYTASVTLNSTYSYDPASRKDEIVDIAENTLNIISLAVRPDVAIVTEAFPLLLHLPSWFPGMSFKRQMAMARMWSKQYLDRPFEYSLKRVRSGDVTPSMVHDALRLMEEKGIPPEEPWTEELKGAAGTALLASSESSSSVLMTFFLLMLLNPAVQEKAQNQIDDVVGKDRLPTLDDRHLLTLVDAIIWETLRYNPVAPLAAPHATVDDDVYGGFYIPKGAIVLVNLWSMSRDESRFPNSDEFIPERFLDGDGTLKPNEVEHIAFGFGRRMCAGRYFADTSLWALVSKVLAVFKISNALDENGAEIPVEPRFSSGALVQPLPFKFRIVPRTTGMDADELERLIATSTA